jgi:hypothetical protein
MCLQKRFFANAQNDTFYDTTSIFISKFLWRPIFHGLLPKPNVVTLSETKGLVFGSGHAP